MAYFEEDLIVFFCVSLRCFYFWNVLIKSRTDQTDRFITQETATKNELIESLAIWAEGSNLPNSLVETELNMVQNYTKMMNASVAKVSMTHTINTGTHLRTINTNVKIEFWTKTFPSRSKLSGRHHFTRLALPLIKSQHTLFNLQ